MTEFKGTSTPPPFGVADLNEIETRASCEGYPEAPQGSLGAVYVKDLCKKIRGGETMNAGDWQQYRLWARNIPGDAQQLKTDLYRLLKEVHH